MRTCYLLLAIDVSGSMSPCAKNVREAVMTYLRKIAEMNADAVDVRYKVKVLSFNDSVREHSTEFLDPAQILEVLTESDFTCSGGTHIGELYEALDRIFSRKGLIGSIDKGDPLPMFLAVSDLVETDSAAMEAASQDLYDNRFFREANRLVLFVGPEDRKAAAVRLAKDEDHVMTISSTLTARTHPPSRPLGLRPPRGTSSIRSKKFTAGASRYASSAPIKTGCTAAISCPPKTGSTRRPNRVP